MRSSSAFQANNRLAHVLRPLGLVLLGLVLSLPAYAGKFYLTFGTNVEQGEVDSVEASLSSGGNYASTVDLGGTLYFNDESFRLVSFDVFSSLDAVQQSNFLFAAGVRTFLMDVMYKPEDLDSEVRYGIAAGFDLGYRFPTAIPTALIGSFDYAPNLLTGTDLRELSLASVLYEVMFTPIVIGLVSYRYGMVDLDQKLPSKIVRFENSIALGIKIRF